MPTWRFLAAAAPLALLALAGCASVGTTVVATNEGGRDRFEPARLEVKAGTAVVFADERGSHTVDFVEPQGISPISSGNIDPGERHEVRLNTPGTYHYFCRYHSSGEGTARTGMVGTIEVTA